MLQRNIANNSIGPSTARGMGPKGTIKSARNFLSSLNIFRLKSKNKLHFQKNHNKITKELQKALPVGAKNWGSARKFLNIFFRNILYNKYLCKHYDILHTEPWLELPLDSHVARGLKSEKGSGHLLRWRTVISLTPTVNRIYQDFALKVSERHNTQRIHLDLLYWRNGNDS